LAQIFEEFNLKSYIERVIHRYKNRDLNRNTLQYICSTFKNLHKEDLLKQIDLLIKISRRIEILGLRSEAKQLEEYALSLGAQ
jgi:hypothetical protein